VTRKNFSERTKALLMLLAGAIAISFSPIIAKMLGKQTMGPTTIAFWRTFIGGLGLVLIAKLQGYRLRMAKNPVFWCVLTGLSFSLDLSIWHRAILLIGAGMSTLIGNTHVFITSLFSHFLFKERLTRRFLIAAPAAFFGLAMLVGGFSRGVVFTPNYLTGVILSIGTALMYAFYMVGLKKATIHKTNPPAATIMSWICLSAAFFLAIGAQFETKSFLPQQSETFFLLMILGVVGQALAWWGIATAMKKIAIHHTALILLLQPVLAMGWGYLFFKETLGVEQVMGALITLTAIYAGSVKSSRRIASEVK